MIIAKVYAVIRYRVYQQIQKKKRAQKGLNQQSGSNPNDSMLSSQSIALNNEDITNMLREIDIEEINREVFTLYNIKYGLDTTLALRKVQILEQDDEYSMDYLECLKKAHDSFLEYIFQGYTFLKMQENPLES